MNLKLIHKLALALGLICLMAVIPAGYALIKFKDALGLVTIISTDDNEVAQALRDIGIQAGLLRSRRDAALAEVAAAQGRRIDAGGPRQQYDDAFRRTTAEIARIQEIVNRRINGASNEERRQLWRQFSEHLGPLRTSFERINPDVQTFFRMLDQGDLPAALAARSAIEGHRRSVDERTERLGEVMVALQQAGGRYVSDAYTDARDSLIIALIIVLMAATLVAYMIGRYINSRIERALHFITAVGAGDLRQDLAIEGGDELSQLGGQLQGMKEGLRDLTRGTAAMAESVHAATAQIRASTQQQAASVAEQLAAVEETTATLSQITASGGQISKRAQDVSSTAQTVSMASQSGLQSIEDTMNAMEAIREQAETVAENIVMLSERTQAIGEIIITVNDIAERSHLLALNAAIEAAAAGEHGRTFAIVAGEIKNLADQAKEATAQVRSNLSEIQHGINASVMLTEEAVKRVAAGRRQTDATGRVMRDMSENIRESVVAFQQIVAGTNQQQLGLEQITQALQNIRQASTQTASGTRQLETAANDLNRLGQTLVEGTRRYKT